MTKKWNVILICVGYICWVSAFFMNVRLNIQIFGYAFPSWSYFVIEIIVPCIGLIASLLSLIVKQYKYLFLTIPMIFSASLSIHMVYLIFGN